MIRKLLAVFVFCIPAVCLASDPLEEAKQKAAELVKLLDAIDCDQQPEPQPQPEPEPEPQTVRTPIGHYALQPGDVNRPLPISVLQQPGCDGECIRIRWREIQPRENFYDWVWLNQQIRRCKELKLPYTILIMTGAGGVPDWAYNQRVPWDQTLIDNYCLLVKMLAGEYAQDKDLKGVYITGPTFMASAEMHAIGDGRNVTSLAGYTPEKLIQAYRQCIDAYADNFANVASILSISGQRDALPYVRPTIEYAKQRLGNRAGFQHNALAAKTQPNATHHAMIAELGAAGYLIGYEMLCPTADSNRFQSSKLEDGLIKSAPQTSYWCIYPGDMEQVK